MTELLGLAVGTATGLSVAMYCESTAYRGYRRAAMWLEKRDLLFVWLSLSVASAGIFFGVSARIGAHGFWVSLLHAWGVVCGAKGIERYVQRDIDGRGKSGLVRALRKLRLVTLARFASACRRVRARDNWACHSVEGAWDFGSVYDARHLRRALRIVFSMHKVDIAAQRGSMEFMCFDAGVSTATLFYLLAEYLGREELIRDVEEQVTRGHAALSNSEAKAKHAWNGRENRRNVETFANPVVDGQRVHEDRLHRTTRRARDESVNRRRLSDVRGKGRRRGAPADQQRPPDEPS